VGDSIRDLSGSVADTLGPGVVAPVPKNALRARSKESSVMELVGFISAFCSPSRSAAFAALEQGVVQFRDRTLHLRT